MKGYIYIIKNSINEKVYIGQTARTIEARWNQHKNAALRGETQGIILYNAMRKYGIDNFYISLLEETNIENLNEREKYWIKYYNTYWEGYNQTIGGTWPTKPKYTDELIQTVIYMLQNEEFSYNDIQEKTGMSLTHIYNINIGTRRPQENIQYPIRKSNTKGTRGIKFNSQQIEEIHQALLNSNKDFGKLALEYDCSRETISKINRGMRKAYRLPGYSYPLRKHPHSNAKKSYWENLNK